MKLVGKRVVIIPNQPHDKIGGLYLPDQSKEERHTGIVALIGDDVDKKFDKRMVLFNKNAKENMVFEGLDAYLMYSFDIIAILQ
jgi:co-chaperonin GroES (HSP10)